MCVCALVTRTTQSDTYCGLGWLSDSRGAGTDCPCCKWESTTIRLWTLVCLPVLRYSIRVQRLRYLETAAASGALPPRLSDPCHVAAPSPIAAPAHVASPNPTKYLWVCPLLNISSFDWFQLWLFFTLFLFRTFIYAVSNALCAPAGIVRTLRHPSKVCSVWNLPSPLIWTRA